jgi:DNA modification methylase
VGQINPAPYNPRVDLGPRDPRYKRLLKSLREFGLVEPLVWNRRTGHLVGGHQRFKVLLARGAKSLQVSVVDLPLDREKALNISLNKPAGDWDKDKLAELLDELVRTPKFDIEITGFDLPAATEIMAAEQIDQADDGFDVRQALEAASGPPLTQPGDLIVLGPHRLLCGDATKEQDVRLAVGGLGHRRADVGLLWTDPPYNVDYTGNNRPVRASTTRSRAQPNSPAKRWAPIRHDHMNDEDYAKWLLAALGPAAGVLAPGAPFYVWNSHKNFGLLHSQLTGLGLRVASVITWAKESFSPGFGDYNQHTEFCLYGWKPGNADGKPGGHAWFGPPNESTLWSVNRERTGSYEHPTQKPLLLAERAIRNSTLPGAIVLDPFLGSGTALIAAARLGRRCVGLELEPRYCDVIVRRFMALAGTDAVAPRVAKRYASPKGAAA